MANGANFTCPNCGQLNFVAFAQIKKNLKGSSPIAFHCGCTLPPNKVLDELTKILTKEFRKRHPKTTE